MYFATTFLLSIYVYTICSLRIFAFDGVYMGFEGGLSQSFVKLDEKKIITPKQENRNRLKSNSLILPVAPVPIAAPPAIIVPDPIVEPVIIEPAIAPLVIEEGHIHPVAEALYSSLSSSSKSNMSGQDQQNQQSLSSSLRVRRNMENIGVAAVKSNSLNGITKTPTFTDPEDQSIKVSSPKNAIKIVAQPPVESVMATVGDPVYQRNLSLDAQSSSKLSSNKSYDAIRSRQTINTEYTRNDPRPRGTSITSDTSLGRSVPNKNNKKEQSDSAVIIENITLNSQKNNISSSFGIIE